MGTVKNVYTNFYMGNLFTICFDNQTSVFSYHFIIFLWKYFATEKRVKAFTFFGPWKWIFKYSVFIDSVFGWLSSYQVCANFVEAYCTKAVPRVSSFLLKNTEKVKPQVWEKSTEKWITKCWCKFQVIWWIRWASNIY